MFVQRPSWNPNVQPPKGWDEDSYPYAEWMYDMYRDAELDAIDTQTRYESEED